MTPIITRALYGFNTATEADAKIEALIDDFARKERERCASRFAIKWKGEDEQGKHYIAAVLADEEDE
jgi:hypothetical protein